MIQSIWEDNRIILTLDAGGTNFVFSAIQAGKEITKPIELPTSTDSLDAIIGTIINGFTSLIDLLDQEPYAISFAFPGPADYPKGIIGDLPNLPAFRGGVALKPVLENKFDIPVFVNNDGNLFAYGEAIAGFLPYVNDALKKRNNIKQYHNLVGLTLGTGFGGGIVRNKELLIGDNSNASEVWSLQDFEKQYSFIEESISIRAIKREYLKILDGNSSNANNLSPKDIFELVENGTEKQKEAAKLSFERFGRALGQAIANIVTIIDGLIVLGGGISNAYKLFMPACMEVLNGKMKSYNGEEKPRLPLRFYDIEDSEDFNTFLKGQQKKISVPFSNQQIEYDSEKRVAIGKSVLGTSKASAIGAYAFALSQLNKKQQYHT